MTPVEIGDAILYRGDCLERMSEIPDGSVDMVLTDPPYGTTVCKWDSVIPLEPIWAQLRRVIKPKGAIVMTASQPFTTTLIASNTKMFKYCWVWESNKAANFAQAPYMPLKIIEDVAVFSLGSIAKNSKIKMAYYPQGLSDIDEMRPGAKGYKPLRPNRMDQKPYKQTKTGYPKQVLKFDKVNRNIHPTQKPVALMEYLIKTYTNAGEAVLDFTMGSGTTGVAAINLGRGFIGIEKDTKELKDYYFNIACGRILEAHINAITP